MEAGAVSRSRVMLGGSALTRGPAHACAGRVIPSAPSLPHSSWPLARSAERWSWPWSWRELALERVCTAKPCVPSHSHSAALRILAMSVLAPGCMRRQGCSRMP